MGIGILVALIFGMFTIVFHSNSIVVGVALNSGAWAMTRPPCSFTAYTPLVPSEPVPESTTTMECSRFSSAREEKKMSMGWLSVPEA